MLSDLACRSRRQRSQRRRDGKLKAEEEQQSEINSGSPPEKQAQPRRGRPLDITSRVNPGQEPVTTTGNPGQESAAANASSSAHDASSEKTIVSASSSTVANRFSASPVVQEASPVQTVAQDHKQLPTANTYHHSASDGDDHVNHHLIAALDHGEGDGDGQEEAEREPPSGSGSGDVGTVNRGGPESRSAAFVSDFEAAARIGRIPFFQAVRSCGSCLGCAAVLLQLS